MKKLLLAFCFAFILFAATRVESAPAAPAEPAVPPIVSVGFNAYQNGGASSAINAWIKGSPLGVVGDARTRLFNTLSTTENTYGSYTGWETIRVVNLSASTKLVYAIAKYNRGPVWIAFSCFRSTDGWIIPTIAMSADPAQVLPEQIRSGL